MRQRSDKSLPLWRKHLRASYAPKSVQTAVAVLAAVSHGSGVDPWLLTPELVEQYLDARVPKRWSRRGYLRWLRNYCRWARLPDVTRDIRRPAAPAFTPDPVADLDLDGLLTAPMRAIDREWIAFGAFMGLRSHEVAKVHVRDFSRGQDGQLYLRVEGKWDNEDFMPVHPYLEQVVAERRATASGYLYPGLKGNLHVKAASISSRIHEVAKDLGIALRFHQLRHWFGTMIHELYGDQLLTMRALRHKSPDTCAGYAKIRDAQRRRAILALPAPDRSSGKPVQAESEHWERQERVRAVRALPIPGQRRTSDGSLTAREEPSGVAPAPRAPVGRNGTGRALTVRRPRARGIKAASMRRGRNGSP